MLPNLCMKHDHKAYHLAFCFHRVPAQIIGVTISHCFIVFL